VKQPTSVAAGGPCGAAAEGGVRFFSCLPCNPKVVEARGSGSGVVVGPRIKGPDVGHSANQSSRSFASPAGFGRSRLERSTNGTPSNQDDSVPRAPDLPVSGCRAPAFGRLPPKGRERTGRGWPRRAMRASPGNRRSLTWKDTANRG